MRLLEISAVSCSRKGTYDAEVQFRYGYYDKPDYKQVFISGGWLSSKSAKEQAEIVARAIENELINKGLELMGKYKEAKP